MSHSRFMQAQLRRFGIVGGYCATARIGAYHLAIKIAPNTPSMRGKARPADNGCDVSFGDTSNWRFGNQKRQACPSMSRAVGFNRT